MGRDMTFVTQISLETRVMCVRSCEKMRGLHVRNPLTHVSHVRVRMLCVCTYEKICAITYLGYV